MIRNLAVTLLLSSLASSLFAAPAASQFTSDFMYGDSPIDALCFFNLEEEAGTINLQNCGVTKENYVRNSEKGNDKLFQQGFIGFNWQDNANHAEGYSYYKIFPAGNGEYWVYSINSGGGSGVFSAIDLVSRKDASTLAYDFYAGGDRCNDGIQDVTEKDHQLTFSMNLTPVTFLSLTNGSGQQGKTYEKLADCAACCVAKAFYTLEPGYDPVLQYVDLGKRTNNSSVPEQGSYTACFNKLIDAYFTKGKTKLSAVELKELVREFNQTCMVQ